MVYQPLNDMIGQVSVQQQVKCSTKEKPKHEEELFLANLAQHLNKQPTEKMEMYPQEKSDNLDRLSGFGLGVGSLYFQEVLGYPFVVLRRQCQANHMALHYHLLPFSLFPVIGRVYRTQGINVFWKGWGSSCVLQALGIVTEIGIFEALHLRKDHTDSKTNSQQSKIKQICIKEALKGASLLLTLPFYSTSLIDSVQSSTLYDSRNMFTFLKDGFFRIVGWYSQDGYDRLLPLHSLILPTLSYVILRYSIHAALSSAIMRLYDGKLSDEKTTKENMNRIFYAQLVSSVLSSLLTDVLLYPLETCVVGLNLQGTRTIIDDTDKGIGIVPLCTNYSGLVDCIKTIKREDGVMGFYKGFGALVLQYSVQMLVVKISKIFYFK